MEKLSISRCSKVEVNVLIYGTLRYHASELSTFQYDDERRSCFFSSEMQSDNR